MDERILQRHFRKMGADLTVETVPARGRRLRGPEFELDVIRSHRGECFRLAAREDVMPHLEAVVISVQPETRNLLLLVRQKNLPPDEQKHKFLCGHDERHWFVAAVPEVGGVGTLPQALEALKPEEVRHSQIAGGVRAKDRNRRRNAGFVRQGEWFFLPRPGYQPPDEALVLRNEPIQRPGGTPHMVEMLCREGGETVYVSQRYPHGLTEQAYGDLLRRDTDARKFNWRVMRRNPKVFAMGAVRHPDHKTIHLPHWHRVVMSAERRSRNVAFLD